jgi:uncharacterized protein (TIGR03643 family)
MIDSTLTEDSSSLTPIHKPLSTYSVLSTVLNFTIMNKNPNLSSEDIDRIIEMAWEDRTPFDAIEFQFNLSEAQVIKLMKREMKLSSWKRWRARVAGRKTKHAAKRNFSLGTYKCSRQKAISNNKISKR